MGSFSVLLPVRSTPWAAIPRMKKTKTSTLRRAHPAKAQARVHDEPKVNLVARRHGGAWHFEATAELQDLGDAARAIVPMFEQLYHDACEVRREPVAPCYVAVGRTKP